MGKRICRVCGKPYEACHSLAPVITTFRWQEVACSPECGAEYLRRILISRGELPNDDVIEQPSEKEVDEDAE